MSNTTLAATIVGGCEQGGVLSPLLWNLTLDSLIRKLNSLHFYTVGYADDLVILVKGKHVNVLCDRLQEGLKIVENWCKDHSLSVNPKKTEMVLFTRKRKLGNYRLPKFCGTQLTLSKEVKYLGVTFDSKLNWNSHLTNRTQKATIAFNQCRRAIGKTWGLTPKAAMWIYTAVIRPMLTHGALVWWPCTKSVFNTNKLNHIQRVACLGITGAMRTTPRAAMENMLCLTPLNIHVREMAIAAMVRLRPAGHNWEIDYGARASELWRDAVKSVPLLGCSSDQITTTYRYIRPKL